MVQLRMITRDGMAADGSLTVGRGFEVRDDEDRPLDRERLHPARFADIAVVDVEPTSVEEREAMRDPAFGVERRVSVEIVDGDVLVRDEHGDRQAGRVEPNLASAVAALLREQSDLATWVCWEWLGEQGRSGMAIAVSTAEVAPGPLGPPPQPSGASRTVRDRRLWLILAAVVVVAAVVLLLGR